MKDRYFSICNRRLLLLRDSLYKVEVLICKDCSKDIIINVPVYI